MFSFFWSKTRALTIHTFNYFWTRSVDEQYYSANKNSPFTLLDRLAVFALSPPTGVH